MQVTVDRAREISDQRMLDAIHSESSAAEIEAAHALIDAQVAPMNWWDLMDHIDDLDALMAECEKTLAGQAAIQLVVATHKRMVRDDLLEAAEVA